MDRYLASLDWRSQCLLYGPSFSDSRVNATGWKSQLVCPLLYCQSFAAKLKIMIVSSITRLLCYCGPSAVIRRIAKIVVNSVNAIFGSRARPHIGIEILKAVSPSLAYRNASIPIIFIRVLIGVFASRNNGTPDRKFTGIAHAVRLAKIGDSLSIEAATAFCVFANELDCGNNTEFAAVAFAKPHCVTILARADVANYSQAAKLPTGNILSSLAGYGNDLRQIVRGAIVEVHQKLPFWCLIREHSRGAARYFYWVRTPVIIAQVGGANK